MSKKAKAAPAEDIDDMIDDAPAPAKKAAKKAAAPAPAAKKAAATKKAAAPAAKKTTKKDAAPAPTRMPAADSPVRKALLKVKKAISYADFAEANDFPLRTVRRTARALRNAGELCLTRDGQQVYISAAV